MLFDFMKLILLRNFVCLLCLLHFTVNCALIIRTNKGPVKGREYTVGSVTIRAYKNIPYAKPPVGELRFELPLDVDSWESEKDLKSQNQRVHCPQISWSYFDQKTTKVVSGQEDCLVLDIYSQKNPQGQDLLPVLVYFHGGHFFSGSKNEYYPEFLISHHNIIVVIPNYRLGALGFLSSSDWKLRGNLGLWDQRKALKWVQENIHFFGGDKNKVTISGHGAGGASVGMHIISPQSYGLFRAAISASGTALDPWVISHANTAQLFAEKVECSRNSTEKIILCLKHSDLNKIIITAKDFKKVSFAPIIDSGSSPSFLPDEPQKLYQLGRRHQISYLAGVTKNEASFIVFKEFPKAVKHKHLDHIIQHLMEPYLRGTNASHIFAKAAKYHYLRGMTIPSFDSVQPVMETIMTDFLYNSPLQTTLLLHSLRTPETFMYVFDFGQHHSPLGVSHMIDAFYLFNKTFGTWTPSFRTEKIRKIMCDMWGHFVKMQRPGDISIWKTFWDLHDTNYVEISDRLSHKTNYRKFAMEFWNLLVPDLKYYHNLKPEIQSDAPEIIEQDYSAWGLVGMAIMLMVLCVGIVGSVVITRRSYTGSSIIPISSSKDDIKYTTIA